MVLSNSQWLANPDTGHEIENSLRFNYGDTPQFTRTIGSPTSTQKFTFSCWIKPCTFFNDTSSRAIFSAATPGNSSSDRDIIGWTNDALLVAFNTGSWYEIKTTQVFRDPSSWYNIVVAMDTTQSTASNRTKIYINGSQVTDFSAAAYVGQNDTIAFCTDGKLHSINSYAYDTDSTSDRIDGYLADVNFIDGQQLGPDSFGETNSKTGQWIPIDTTGLTFGNNGFLLEFKDNSFIGKSTHQRTGNEELIPQDAGTIIKSSAMGFSETISFDNAISTNYPTVNQWRLDIQPDDGCFIGKDYGADNTIVATGFKVYPTGDYGFDTWTNASSSSTYSLQLQGSNDGTNYTNIGAANTSVNGASSATKVSGLSNSTAYRYVRLLIDGVGYGGTQHWFAVSEIEFFGVGTYFNAQSITTADQMTDTPTNNTCTLNQLITPATTTIVNGNLDLSGYTASSSAYGTFGMSSGKWYWELVAQANAMAGIAATPNGSQYPGQASDSYAFDLTNGTKYNNGSSASFGSSAVSAGNTVGVAFDADNGDLKFYNNSGSLIGTAYSSLTSGPYFPVFRNGNSANISINFGQQTFSHSIPTSHAKLTAPNLPDPTIALPTDHFDIKLWTGNDTDGRAITGYNFQPDWVWIKSRSGAYSHSLSDAVRGAGVYIQTNTTDTQVSGPGAFGSTLAFTSDGYTLDNGTSDNLYVNAGGETYVGWAWKANGSGSSNTDGSVSSTVSANQTAGFSIVKWVHTTSANYTVGHGLGAVPKLVIVKTLDQNTNWGVFHSDITLGNRLILNTTGAQTTGYWGANTFNSTVFSIGSDRDANSSNAIGYCFAEIPGYSKISSFVGNGSADGTFVFTGFRPAFLVTKNISSSGNAWPIADNKRSPFNLANATVFTNFSNAETTGYQVDLLSNGFKARTTDNAVNKSGDTIVYWAFAETPFKTANAR